MSKKLRKLLFDLKDENWLPSMPDETREIFIQLILNQNKEDDTSNNSSNANSIPSV